MKRLSMFAAALLLPLSLALAGVAEDVSTLQQKWEQVRYKTAAPAQEAQYAQLLGEAQKLAQANPNSAEILIWYAIIESTYAGAKGGLGALSHAKSARKTLEQAIALNPDALSGSAYTSLGSLYYQVPGWPLGFGDDKKALELLKKGLAVNPDGIDPNYFYGDYLYRQGDYASRTRPAQSAAGAAAPGPQGSRRGPAR